jgi:hypothetical protein
MLNKKFTEIALSVGGSHYPEVGGRLLQQFGETVINQCIDLLDQAEDREYPRELYSELIRNYFGVK